MTGSLGLDVFLFIAGFLGILVTSYWAIEAIKTVSERFRISETFIGAAFLSVGTSFPEFINSIRAGIADRSYLVDTVPSPQKSIESFYNITGANIWQVLFLAVVVAILAIYWRTKKREDLEQITRIFWKDSYLSWKLTFLETCFLVFVFVYPGAFSHFTVGGFNFIGLLFLLVWFCYICRTYKSGTETSSKERAKYFLNCDKITLGAITLSLWSLFGAFSLMNFLIAEGFGIDPSTSFGVILSFVTSSPEFSVMYFLFKQKEYQMAVSGFFGSSLFNLSLPCCSNLISLNTIFGREGYDDPKFARSKITLWLVLNVLVISIFLLTFTRSKKHREFIVAGSGLLILILYVTISSHLGRPTQ